ncbi:hypothetical protein P879_03939 [Paragonimus westermani]|uniref:SOCS box domain-containing protein n=1 Tax=Paragonimus westermani TaxID=34504 RepID=A0A8T0DPX9_9TREM|nr:hypothetical protein P879_03939 [Paragonimus westermani]
MGLDESKLSQSPKKHSQCFKICVSAPIVPWRIIHQCSPDLWKKVHREYFNFPDTPMVCNYQIPLECTPAFCLTRQDIMNCRKPCSVFSLRKRKKCSKMAEHFEYNHIPARLSSIQNLHFKSILDTRSGLAVVHLARDMITQFAVLDLHINKFLGSFGRQTVSPNLESTFGKISPDGSLCLIKLPSVRNRRVSILKLYDLRSCELLTELLLSPVPCAQSRPTTVAARSPLAPRQDENRLNFFHTSAYSGPVQPRPVLPGSAAFSDENQQPIVTSRTSPVLFAFDPRFLHTRIAITNLHFVDLSDEATVYDTKPSVTLMKLPGMERVATTSSFKCPSVASRSSPMMGGASSRSGHNISNVSGNVVGSALPNLTSSAPNMPTRVLSRRRRSSDTNHNLDPAQPNGQLYTSPHILSIFYSKDGYLLFVVSTEHRVCRCSSIGHHSSMAAFPFFHPEPIDVLDEPQQQHHSIATPVRGVTICVTDGDRLQQQQQHQPQSKKSNVVTFSTPSISQSVSRSPKSDHGCRSAFPLQSNMSAPTLPGCTTLWLTIFNSDTLARLRTLRFDRPVCPVHTCPTNYIPVMSRCGSRLALITNKYAYHPNPRSNALSPTITTTINSSTYGLSSSERMIATSLRHSIPSVNTEVYERNEQWTGSYCQPSDSKDLLQMESEKRHSGGSVVGDPASDRRVTRSLASSSSPTLPPLAADFVQPMLTASSNLSFPLCTAPFRSDGPMLSRVIAGRLSSSEHLHHPHTSDGGAVGSSSSTCLPIALFSSFGSAIARQVEVLLVYQLPPPPSLQALIRQKILQMVQDEMLDRLDLPSKLIDYLRFQPMFSCAGSCLSRSNSVTPTLRSESFDLSV